MLTTRREYPSQSEQRALNESLVRWHVEKWEVEQVLDRVRMPFV